MLLASVEGMDFRGVDLLWLARLARIILLQPSDIRRRQFAHSALAHSVPQLPATPETFLLRKFLVETLIVDGSPADAERAIESDEELREEYHSYLLADARNPFEWGRSRNFDSWIELFNAPFRFHEMQSVWVDQKAINPFNSMRAEAPGLKASETLVSVILTTFNPDPDEIRTSVRSVLQQSWRNLELLLVDDCSDETSAALLADLEKQDPRVHLIRLPVNGGTYQARNAGLREARGHFITGQDTDDWSHPERITRQVQAFEENPDVPAVMTTANRMTDNLIRVSPGLHPYRRCEVSLMVRRETALAAGGYLPVRKGADSEFRERVEALEGAPTHRLPDPLYLIRLSPQSLSRSDFRVGWAAHSRRNFSSAYRHWHRTAARTELVTFTEAADIEMLPFTPPARISGLSVEPPSIQLGFVCDWRADSMVQRAALDEIYTALEAGVSVAVMQFDTPHSWPLSPSALIPPVQDLINRRDVVQLSTEDEASIDLLIVRDPACTDYARMQQSSITVGGAILVADDSMVGSAPELWNYNPQHAQKMTQRIFNVEPSWSMLNRDNVARFSKFFGVPANALQYPLVVRHFTKNRRPFSPARPIIGRVAKNVQADWPRRETLESIYPTDGTVDVRVLGDPRGGVRELRGKHVPAAWRAFQHGQVSASAFWRTVEFAVVYDQRGDAQSVSREVLEAMAASCVVIMKPEASIVYSDAIEASNGEDVSNKIHELRKNRPEYLRRTDRARQFLHEQCSPRHYVKFLTEAGVLTSGADHGG